MKVLVLGGTRFFGIHLVDELLKSNCDITIATAESLVGYKENEEIVVRDRTIESEEPQLIWKIENGRLIRATA